MRKIEQAPVWYKNQDLKDIIALQAEEYVKAFIRSVNEEYLYWDKIKYQKTEPPIRPETLCALTKLSRLINEKKIQIGEYTFKFNTTDKIQKNLHEFDLNLGGNLGSQGLIPEEDKKRYLISSIMEEAIASSQIEGAVTARKHAKDMLRKESKPKNKSEQMIVNNFATIKHIVNIKDEPLTKERLFEIHRLITHQTLDDSNDEGKYRKSNEVDVIDAIDGEIVYSPPDFHQLPKLMNELFLFFNKEDKNTFIHPIVKACIIHFLIGFIHPFVDGNGRTARALFYWYLLKKGYWLTEYLSISRMIIKSKSQYAKAYLYTEIDDLDLTYFIHYKVKTMQLAFEDLRKYIERKINEKKQVGVFQKINGINERQALIIKWVNEDPEIVLSVKEIENKFNVANQTARTDLDILEERGFLTVKNINKKTKAYFKSPNFDSLIESK
jgi:Fic family protein